MKLGISVRPSLSSKFSLGRNPRRNICTHVNILKGNIEQSTQCTQSLEYIGRVYTMLLILDGNSDSLLFDLLKAFDRAQSQIGFFLRKELFSFMRAHHVLSYQPISVHWCTLYSLHGGWGFAGPINIIFRGGGIIDQYINYCKDRLKSKIYIFKSFDYITSLFHLLYV